MEDTCTKVKPTRKKKRFLKDRALACSPEGKGAPQTRPPPVKVGLLSNSLLNEMFLFLFRFHHSVRIGFLSILIVKWNWLNSHVITHSLCFTELVYFTMFEKN